MTTLLWILWLGCGSAAAEVVVLKNGRAVAGLRDFELLPSQLRAKTADGVVIYFDLDQIDREATRRLNPKPAPPPAAAPVGAAKVAAPPAPPRPSGGSFSASPTKVVAESPGWPAAAVGSNASEVDRDPGAYFRARAAELNRSIDYRERQLRREQEHLGEVLVAESVGAYTVEGTLVRQRIERSLAHLQELHQRRRELEDQARRAGVPPGWLRGE